MAGDFKQRAKVAKGKLVPEAPGVWAACVMPLEGKDVTVTVETDKRRRSTLQNNYLHGVIIPFFQQEWTRTRRTDAGLPPYSKDEVRAILADACFGTVAGPIDGTHERSEGQGTRNLTTAQFTRLIDFCRQLAYDMYKADLPKPGEPWEAS